MTCRQQRAGKEGPRLLQRIFFVQVVDVSKFGLIYAGAQKNIGIAGVTIVIVRKDLVGNAREGTPTMLDYKTMADSNSLYNTPPCFGIYMCGLVFKHLLDQGGLAAVQEANRAKAKVLYDAIEASEGFFQNPVEVSARSAMNVPFTIPANPELEGPFMQEAAERGLVTLKGHRSVGGMRASIYNAMPVEGIVSLVELMEDFAKRHS
ncbi:unnamed protein product [Ostreobium quekettii]|uniref:phosphoserine transaminase n=1 Tax=Ostreobium quekettii TaxID=121088 RepID=A0A8S1JGD9_9CHLO|nr:unnamed protein product [Ostreobium quekettii]